MSVTNTKLTFKVVFADDTTDTITINNVNPNKINPDLKSIVRNFNAQQGGDLASKMQSKSGANWIGISAVSLTTTVRDYYNMEVL